MGSGGADAAHGHAQVLRFDDHCHALRIQLLLQEIGYLFGKAFLKLGDDGQNN